MAMWSSSPMAMRITPYMPMRKKFFQKKGIAWIPVTSSALSGLPERFPAPPCISKSGIRANPSIHPIGSIIHKGRIVYDLQIQTESKERHSDHHHRFYRGLGHLCLRGAQPVRGNL